MPKENKRRGRRDEKKNEKKRKRREEAEAENTSKKRKFEDGADFIALAGQQENGDGQQENIGGMRDIPFYGLLNTDEQEYFKRADEMLELNQFNSAEERGLFLENIYKEADGKELKIAASQSCSRLMERLTLLSTPAQLKNLFQKFSGHFLNLVQHRFASHCCETLFIKSAPIVTQELTAPLEEQHIEEDSGIYVSMENLFLFTINEFEGSMGYLMTDRFASHALRVLLVVLSGQPLAKPSAVSLLQSKKKEKVRVPGFDSEANLHSHEKRLVPEVFQSAVDKIMSETVLGLDTTFLRSLATHPTGNPMLQLLLELELSGIDKGRAKGENSILRKLLPDDPASEGTESASFVNGLLYDPIGSRLLEVIVRHAPGKMFKTLYRNLLKDRIGSLARNETAGFVVTRVLDRLSKQDLEEATKSILPQVSGLVERSRTVVIRSMIERCVAKGIDMSDIAGVLNDAYGGDTSTRISKMLRFQECNPGDTNKGGDHSPETNSEQLYGSLLVQSMLVTPGPLSALIFEGILALPARILLAMAENQAASRVLQASLTSPTSTTQFRRKIINSLFGETGRLATSMVGSHVVDALWIATAGLEHYRERIASELLNNEATMRESFVGRAVWKNWMMDLFKHRKTDWIAKAKASEREVGGAAGKMGEVRKTGIELAREKFAAAKLRSDATKTLHSDTKRRTQWR
ncbi:MAG: Nucleolar protein 9 [Trichoglossum hirsutum]|nr:MAG: Nucleolar protein 9 [Trichoglossum hirsutum]